MALREIRTIGDEVLRKKCKPVREVNDRVRMLLQDIEDTLRSDENGAGLAAPQIGILRRLIVVNAPDGEYLKLVNPEIVASDGEHEVVEGCLSVPGRWGKLMRPVKVTVKALDENGKEVTIEAENDYAKLFCHEIDHLDGVLFIDKVTEFIDDDEDWEEDDEDDEDGEDDEDLDETDQENE
ncbi:MAG: peptide deformylase [Christensenellaceae bacterium]|nr:peptide deformylase [Christensenellaceae bacterium]